MLSIEQDNPGTLERTREMIARVTDAPNEYQKSFNFAASVGWILGLSREGIISKEMAKTLQTELAQVNDAWKEP